MSLNNGTSLHRGGDLSETRLAKYRSIPCISLGFPVFAVYSLMKGNLNGGYICFLSILGIIPKCCNITGFLHILYPGNYGRMQGGGIK